MTDNNFNSSGFMYGEQYSMYSSIDKISYELKTKASPPNDSNDNSPHIILSPQKILLRPQKI